MLDLRSFVWPARKIVMRGHGFCWCECERKKTFEKKADQIVTLYISFRSAQSKFEATFTDTAKVKLFTAENESSNKTAVSLDTPLFGCNRWFWVPPFGVFYYSARRGPS